jgi:hypothetical protein
LPAFSTHAEPGDHRAIDEWQRNRLLSPPRPAVRQEVAGRVFIYEEMLEADIDKAMDKQFERIENMMFIRTIPTDKRGEPLRDSETGQVLIGDDGCE